MRPGDAVVIPPGTPHKLLNTGPEPLVLLCCCAPAYSTRTPSSWRAEMRALVLAARRAAREQTAADSPLSAGAEGMAGAEPTP